VRIDFWDIKRDVDYATSLEVQEVGHTLLFVFILKVKRIGRKNVA
jgi:hypothetical protein